MFSLAPTFTHLAVRREQVITLLHSMNAVAVKVPGFAMSPAMGYLAGWDNDDGTISVLVYLHYAASARAVAYLHDPPAFSLAELPAVVEEAVEFLESMGFMLDDPGFDKIGVAEQRAMIERTPLFHADLARFAEARAGEELPEIEVVEVERNEADASRAARPQEPSKRAGAIGRVLMSF